MAKGKEKNVYDWLYKDTTYGSKQASIGLRLTDYALSSLKFKSVLDVGCGSGYSVLKFLKEGKQAQGIETSEYLVSSKLRQMTDLGITRYGSITNIPFDMDSFDLVYCTEVLEHLEERDVHKALSELVRVSKKYIFCTVSFVESQAHPGLHLTVKPYEWWKGHFDSFPIKLKKVWDQDHGGIYIYQKTQ